MTKKEIRSYMRKKKSELTPNQIVECSDCITNYILNSDEYKEAKVIYCYVSFNQEIKTNHIINQSLRDKKVVAVPKIDIYNNSLKKERKDDARNEDSDKTLNIGSITSEKPMKEMNFYYINSEDELILGYYGILEPTTSIISNDSKVLMIVPGLAFDLSFHRIGYGAGFYDRYFQTHSGNHYEKIALAYDFQVLHEIESYEYDMKVNQIVTPSKIYTSDLR